MAAGNRGFSILEFLLAAVILAVGLLGLGGLQVASLRARGATRAQLGGLALATSALEEALGQARIHRARGGGPEPPLGSCCPYGEGATPVYTVTWPRGPRSSGRVTVRVSWRAGDAGTPRALSLTRQVSF